MRRRIRDHWRGISVGAALVLILGVIAISTDFGQQLQADRKYAAAAAEADRLDPQWRLDDILAARDKVPDEENSTLKVRDVDAKLPGGWPGIKQYDTSFSFEGESPEVRLSQERLEQLQSVFETAEDVISAARILADYPRGGLYGERRKAERLEPVGNVNAMIDVNFPYGIAVHRVAFLLWLDAKLRIEAGDLETALVDLRAMVTAGRSIGDYPGLSAGMSRAGAIWRAIPCLETALAQGQAGSMSLAALQALLVHESRHPARMIVIRGERAIIDDLFEQIHAGKATSAAIPEFSNYPFWVKAMSSRGAIRETQANLLAFHTQQVEAGKEPEAEQVRAMRAQDKAWVEQVRKWGFLEQQRRLTERLLLGRAGGAPTWLGIGDAQIRTAIAALAAERHRIDRGRWPETLQELVPKYLDEVPRDPFVQGPLKLRKLGDGIFIWLFRRIYGLSRRARLRLDKRVTSHLRLHLAQSG